MESSETHTRPVRTYTHRHTRFLVTLQLARLKDTKVRRGALVRNCESTLDILGMREHCQIHPDGDAAPLCGIRLGWEPAAQNQSWEDSGQQPHLSVRVSGDAEKLFKPLPRDQEDHSAQLSQRLLETQIWGGGGAAGGEWSLRSALSLQSWAFVWG